MLKGSYASKNLSVFKKLSAVYNNVFVLFQNRIWKENSIAKKFSPQAAELYRSAFTLRQRMMNAVQNLEYYMMIEVIEPNWHLFIQNMSKVNKINLVLFVCINFHTFCFTYVCVHR